MIPKVTMFLSRAGLDFLAKPAAFCLVLVSVVAGMLLVANLTNSVSIAISLFVCLFAQALDTLNARIASLQREQDADWPKYLDAIHSAIWSGSSLQEAILSSSTFAPKGAAWAFLELEKDLESGLTLDESLVNLKTRLANPVADRFAEITRLANLVGGHGYLSGLRNQAHQLRLEVSNWDEISVKQSWVIGSARLAVFAPWLILLLLSLRSETGAAFNTEIGITILVFGLLSSLLAFRMVRFLAKLPSRKRILES